MLNTVEAVLRSDFAIAIRDWGAWGVALLALWISHRQYQATTADKLPNLRVTDLSSVGGVYSLSFSLQNYSDKPLLLKRVEVKGGGRVFYADEAEYNTVTGETEIKEYTQATPRLLDVVPPAGTPRRDWSAGDVYWDVIRFKAGVAKSLKFVVHYQLGNEDAKARKIKTRREVTIDR